MRKWTILTSTLIVGIAVAVGVWFFVKFSTENAEIDTSFAEDERGFFSFFGERLGFIDTGPATTTETPGGEAPAGPSFRERLARAKMLPISTEMLGGVTFTTAWEVSTTTGATTTKEFVRFVERKTGHLADLSLETGLAQRITNTTVPGVQEALWGESGSAVALRYLADDNETVETFVAPLATTTQTEPSGLEGTFFPQNISSISMSPAGREVFYITTTPDRASGYLTSLSNENRRTIFTSSLREWSSLWETPGMLFVTTKPSASAVGVSYALSRDGDLVRVASAGGLSILPSPSGTRVLYSAASNDSFRSFVLTRDTQETVELSVTTIPEKCVWRSDDELICAIPNAIPANIPDAWYQGRVSFVDTLWTIDVVNERYDFLFAPEDTEARQTMDIINPDLSDDGTILSLINKKDLQGWVADVGDTNN